MNSLLDSIASYEGVDPYSDVSLRVIMRMADVLMYRHEIKMYEISEHDEVFKELNKF